jgi:hypothetical protein
MVAENTLKIEYKPISELVEYARNPRKNNDVVDKMRAAIREFGFRIPIVAQSDGSVVDGHLRLKAARKLGLDKARQFLQTTCRRLRSRPFGCWLTSLRTGRVGMKIF